MTQQQEKYSLWLRPAQTQIDELTKIISKLAHNNFTTPFPPHITLVSQINKDKEHIKRACMKIVAQYQVFDITLTNIAYSKDYFRNLYIQAILSTSLFELHRESKRLLMHENTQKYYPHVSLLYGKLNEKQQLALQKELNGNYPNLINCHRLDIYNITGIESQWYLEESFYLK